MSGEGDMSYPQLASEAAQSYPQLATEATELLAGIAELGVNLTGLSETSLQHVTLFWDSHSELVKRHSANSCNVAVLGLAKSGDALTASCLPSVYLSLFHMLTPGWNASLPSCPAMAGKSTVLNALIGSRVLPTSNVPETARITRLRHSKQCVEPVLATSGGGQPIVGADAVHAHLEMLNRQVPSLQSPCAHCRLVLFFL